jgi:hypothetical protein
MSQYEAVRFEPNTNNFTVDGAFISCDIYCFDEQQDDIFESMGIPTSKRQTALWMDGVFDLDSIQMAKNAGPIIGCDENSLTMLFFKSSIYDYMIIGINFPEFVGIWKNYKQGPKSKRSGKV